MKIHILPVVYVCLSSIVCTYGYTAEEPVKPMDVRTQKLVRAHKRVLTTDDVFLDVQPWVPSSSPRTESDKVTEPPATARVDVTDEEMADDKAK